MEQELSFFKNKLMQFFHTHTRYSMTMEPCQQKSQCRIFIIYILSVHSIPVCCDDHVCVDARSSQCNAEIFKLERWQFNSFSFEHKHAWALVTCVPNVRIGYIAEIFFCKLGIQSLLDSTILPTSQRPKSVQLTSTTLLCVQLLRKGNMVAFGRSKQKVHLQRWINN